jgi:hypothetical protein
MIQIRPTTSIERRLLFLETLLNTAVNEDGSSKISKISSHSVLSGVAGGVAKISGKAEKDVALAVSQLFPDNAYGGQLDQVARDHGIGARLGAIGSSTYIRLVANPGTGYLANTHFFTSTGGITFELEENAQVGSLGFTYAKVRSLDVGSATNVDPLSISKCSPQPSGHLNCINEYIATGGRDIESDEIFRARIKDGPNFVAKGTIAMLEQVFNKINQKVLKIFSFGTHRDGKLTLAIVTQNGVDLTNGELSELLERSAAYFNLNEYRPFGTAYIGIKLINMPYQPLDISVRVELDPSFNPDEIRKQMQINVSKYLDFRYFDTYRNQIQWDKLLHICQNIAGIKYIPDQYFYPRTDLTVDTFTLPRLRSFLMLNLEGQVIVNRSNTLTPVYYPNIIDESFHQTVLKNIT